MNAPSLETNTLFSPILSPQYPSVVEIDDPPDPRFERTREFLRPKLEQQRDQALLRALLERASSNAEVDIDASAFR